MGTNLWEELTGIALPRVWISSPIESHKLSLGIDHPGWLSS